MVTIQELQSEIGRQLVASLGQEGADASQEHAEALLAYATRLARATGVGRDRATGVMEDVWRHDRTPDVLSTCIANAQFRLFALAQSRRISIGEALGR